MLLYLKVNINFLSVNFRATMDFLGASYIYMNAFILAFGVWAIVAPESIDAVFTV